MLPHLLLFAAAAGLLAPVPVLADIYTITVPANSPTLRYSPGQKGNTAAGEWNSTYTDADSTIPDKWAKPADGLPAYWATGASGDGAPTLTYSFTGTSISFVGYWGVTGSHLQGGTSVAGSVDLVVDGKTVSNSGGGDGKTNNQVLLVESGQLDNGKHDVSLVIRSGNVTVLWANVGLDFGNMA